MFPNRYGNKKYNTTDISIIDTPAIASNESIFDLRNEFSEQQQHTVVYAVVIAIGRFTAEEKQIIESFISNNNVAHRTLLMFTRKNELDVFECAEKEKLNAWLETTPNIQTWIDKYKLRYFAIDNFSKVNDSFIDDTIKYAVSISQLMAGKPFYFNHRYGFLQIVFENVTNVFGYIRHATGYGIRGIGYILYVIGFILYVIENFLYRIVL
ncbi:unnamed protein product [Mytilus edulis]|uniref:AIG1-type G domain-containing protein n=1 Tax=Mytilus edulis TaxID=6550 RepID=A0A8S3VDY5_MYTED|nr:unnamed protein product [Mytilus edulis]